MHGYYKFFMGILKAIGVAATAVLAVLLIWAEVVAINTLLNY